MRKLLLLLLLLAGIISCKDKKSPPVRMVFNLSDNYDSANAPKDVELIREMSGVKDVIFISRERAKQIYLSDGNESWDNVLDSNPLPASIFIDMSRKLTPKQAENFEIKIKKQIPQVSTVDKYGVK